MKKILLSLILITPLYNNADVMYGFVGMETGDIGVDSSEYDVTAYELGFIAASGNLIFSTAAASGTVDDVLGYDLDFVGQNIDIGYAFGDITKGTFVLGASYISGEIQNPGSSNIKSSDTEAFIGYSKMSGDGTDYQVSIMDGLISAIAILPVGNSENLRALIGYGSSDESDSISFGVVYKFNF